MRYIPEKYRKYLFCLHCNKKFFTRNDNWHKKTRFCSNVCYHSHPRSEEFKKKISLAFRGENHPRWKGGIMKGRKDRNLMEYKNWRREVFIHDEFTCRLCGIHSGNGKAVYLEAHHIDSYEKHPELRYVSSNGVTLCADCHDITRRKEYRSFINDIFFEQRYGDCFVRILN